MAYMHYGVGTYQLMAVPGAVIIMRAVMPLLNPAHPDSALIVCTADNIEDILLRSNHGSCVLRSVLVTSKGLVMAPATAPAPP